MIKVASTQTKTMLLLMFASSTILFLFSLMVYFFIVRFSHQRFDELLKIRTETLVHTSVNTKFSANDNIYEIKGIAELPLEKDYIVKVSKESSRLDSKILPLPESFFTDVLDNGYATYSDDQFSYAGKKFEFKAEQYIAIAKAENLYVTYYLNYLKQILLICLVLALFFSGIFSYYLSKSLYKPIHIITSKVKKISSENLHLRLDSDNYSNELNELIATFNDMLNRIETSFETQNHLIGNVSHELRTPLTSIMGEAEVALSLERTSESYKQTLEVILNEAEKLDQKIKALLLIAQTGFDGKIQKMDITRMDQLLWDVIDTAKRLDIKSNITVDLSMIPDNPKKLKVKGNEQLLHLALLNIINNACKYSNYDQVKVSLGSSNSNVYIVVRDNGIGIPEGEIEKIFDPFFRASNTQNFEGYGIGLPLAKNIITMHNGTLKITSNPSIDGTIVELRIPTIDLN